MFRVFYLIGIFCLIVPTVRMPFADVGISDVFIFLALGVWVIEYLRHRGQDGWGIPMHILWVPAVLILVGGLLSSFNAARPGTSVSITLKTVFVVSLWVSASIVMVRRGDLLLTLTVFLTAVGTSGIVALVDRWVGTSFGDTISGNRVIFYNRSNGTFGHPNELGYITSVALPLALGLFLRAARAKRSWWVVGALGGAIALYALTLFYSGSVTGWVSAVVSTGVVGSIAFLRATTLRRLAVICGLLLVAGAGIWFFSEPTRQAQLEFLLDFNLYRAATLTGPGRTKLLAEAFAIIEQNPFVGAGMDQTGTGNLDGSELVTNDLIHNTLMGGWLSGGLLVFVGLAICYLVAFVTAVRALWWGFWHEDWLLVGLGACVFGWILFDQTQPNLYHRYTWLTLAWMFGLGLQMRWSNESEPQSDANALVSDLPTEGWGTPTVLNPQTSAGD